MDDIVIRSDNLTKIYQLYERKIDRLKEALFKRGAHTDFYALNNVSFSVSRGENVAFIGKNGSGKSTLLKILTGVLTPSAGTYSIDGRVSALLELGAGFNPEYTGIENVYINGAIMGFTRDEMDERMESILRFADIGAFVYQPIKTYSSGMHVRLAFSVAINVDPDILIIDEALSVGDIFFQRKCYNKFEDFRDAGKTILFVTHDLGSVIKYCSRAYLLNDGVLLEEGAPHDIVDSYKKLMSGIDLAQNLLNADTSDLDSPDRKSSLSETDPTASPAHTGNVSVDGLWSSNYPVNPGAVAYGDLALQIVDFGIFDSDGNLALTIRKGETYTIRVKIYANETIDNPIIAFAIKDIKGTDITGTNTDEENINTGVFQKGQTVVCEFTQRIDLQRTTYFLSLGCVKFEDNGRLRVFNRLYDIIELPIVAKTQSFGYYDMNSKITIKRDDD